MTSDGEGDTTGSASKNLIEALELFFESGDSTELSSSGLCQLNNY